MAPHVRAEEEVVRLEYAAPESCPDEQVFVARVRARTAHGRFAEPGELARTFEVSLVASEQGASFAGQIEFIDVGGERARRSVTGATCDEVTSSLALIMALSIDDRVAPTEARESAPSPSAQPAAPSAPPKEAKPSPPASFSPAPTRGEPTLLRLRWDIGVNVGALTWLTPRAAPLVGLFGEVGSRERSWSARLSAFSVRQTKTVSIGQADFETDWLRAEFCPVAFAATRRVAFTPCAGFDAGAFFATAEGDSLTNIHNRTSFWASGAALLRLDWEVAGRLILGLDGELGVPLVRQGFGFNDPPPAQTTTELFHVPALGVGAKAGVGLRFP